MKRRSLSDHLRLTAGGFCMGSADIIPGVSGGTIAFILGFYEELIQSIRSCTHPETLKALMRFQIAEVWKRINGTFLLSIGVGILVAIFSLAKLLEHLLHQHPMAVWSFFFGLVLASAFVVSRRIPKWQPSTFLSVLIGITIGYLVVGLVPVHTPDTWWFLMLCGAIVICAMILPGISGSFLLVILGKYEYILQAVNNHDFGTLAIFMVGAAVGICAFSHVLGWLLEHKHDATIGILTGLMIGSLRRIWPWKHSDNGAELLQHNVLPIFFENGSSNPETFFLLFLMVVGCVAVLGLEHVVGKQKS